MPLLPEPVQLFRFFGVTASGILTGAILAQSTVATPLLLASPDHEIILKQFKVLARNAGRPISTGALIAALSYFITGYLHPSRGSTAASYSPSSFSDLALSLAMSARWVRYALAGWCVLGAVQYRWLFLLRTERKLDRLYEDEVEGLGFTIRTKQGEVVVVKGEVRGLVDRWGFLNLGRAVPVAMGFLLGAWDLISE